MSNDSDRHMSALEGGHMFRSVLTAPTIEALVAIEEAIAGRWGTIVEGIRRRLDRRLEELTAGSDEAPELPCD